MNAVLTTIFALLFGGVFGLIFISPVFLWKWYQGKKNKAKYLLAKTKLQGLYPKAQMIAVRYCLSAKLNNYLKLSNFNGTGYLLLDKKEIAYHDIDPQKLPILFPIKDLSVSWVGYYFGSGWVPWFCLTMKNGEKYYFTGETINWGKNMEIFRTVALTAGKETEITKSEILDTSTSNKNASWFNIIGFLTLANSALIYFKTDIAFMYGLTIVQISDGAFILSGINTILGLVISAVVCFGMIQLGKSAKQGKTFAYKIGLIVLSLDSLLLLGIIVSSHTPIAYLLINIFFRTLAISAMVRGAFIQQGSSNLNI